MMDSISEYLSEENRELFHLLTPEVLAKSLDPILTAINVGNKKQEEEEIGDATMTGSPSESKGDPKYPDINIDLDALHGIKTTFLGQIGERNVQALIMRKFEVDNVTKTARSTDLTVFWESRGRRLKALVEVKNYRSTVPSSEVEKFYRDLDAHEEAVGAIMVSINTPIQSKNAPAIQYMKRSSGGEIKPVVFMHGWDTVRGFLNASLEIMFVNAMTRDTVNLTDADLTPCINRISDAMEGFSQSRTTILEAQSAMNKYFSRMNSEIMGAEHAIQEQLRVMWSKIEIQETEKSQKTTSAEIMEKFDPFLNDETRPSLATILESLLDDGKGEVIMSDISCEILGNKPTLLRFYKTGKVRCRATFRIGQNDSLPPNNLIGLFSFKGEKITVDICQSTMGYVCRK